MTNLNLDLKGCIKNKDGIICIPLPELINLFNKFPYYLGKDFRTLLEKASQPTTNEVSNAETK